MPQYKFFTAFLLVAGLVGCALSTPVENSKFSGTLEMTEYSLGPNTAGRLAMLAVDEGDGVEKGQLLAALERYAQAEKDYDRLAQLKSSGGASAQDVEHAALARDDLRVVSPVDGVVLVKVREVGETLSPGSPVIVVGDKNDLWLKIYIPEGMINQVTIDQPARVSFDGVKESFKGHVHFIAPRAEFTPRNVQTPEERVTQTFAVKIKLDESPAFFRPGIAADVYLESEKK